MSEVSGSPSVWIASLRRHLVGSGALDRYVDEHGVSGVLWVPGVAPMDDAADAIVRLTEAGARADWSLLWDLVATDAREAAETLGSVWHDREGRDGYAAVWIEPERLGDPSRAAAHAAELVDDAGRGNVAMAFAWQPARAGAVSAIVEERIAVAVSGATDASSREQVAKARQRGMERLRKEDAGAGEVPVFLLGASQGDTWTVPVRLVTESSLLAPGRASRVRLPASPEQERVAFRETIGLMDERARRGARDDILAPEGFASSVSQRLGRLGSDGLTMRIWTRDHTVWGESADEISDRLGWLDVVDDMDGRAADVESFAKGVRSSGVSRVVLLGMGGSSLAPELFHATLPSEIALTVLDSTHPEHVSRVRDGLDLDRTLFVVASKSGTTIETLSHLEYFWSLRPEGDRFVAITDPGTPLAALAAERSFRRVFENPTDIGGRFSALSYFGLVPAALAGVDIRPLLDSARRMQDACAASVPAEASPGFRLGAALAEDGRDKLTFLLPDAISSFGDWAEQLVGESTGKHGRGVVPVCGEDLGSTDVYGQDRLFCAYALDDEPFPAALEGLEANHPVVRIRMRDVSCLGAELFRWELAVAVLGALFGVNPFDQPDVEAAKRRAREALEGSSPAPDAGFAPDVVQGLAEPSYLAILAYVPPTAENVARLQAARMRLRDRWHVATTLGFGPRYLHSTGQLHKGGPPTGRFLQVVEPAAADVDIPGRPYTFGRLIAAQADGDLRELRNADRPAARVTLAGLDDL